MRTGTQKLRTINEKLVHSAALCTFQYKHFGSALRPVVEVCTQLAPERQATVRS